MYCEFFGLRCRPFEDHADTRFFFPTSDAEEAAAAMEYEAHGGKGMALLTGDAGTGKTLLVRTLLHRLHATDHVVVVTWPSNGALDVSRETCKGFGLTLPSSPSDARYLARLRKHLIRTAEADHRSVLIIDQAENLTNENMLQIAVLQELQRDGRQLLSILLVGQSQVCGLLEQPRFARIRQQLFGEKKLRPLNASETTAYVAHRLRVAGSGDALLFSDDALRLVHEAARGIPRLINHVCQASLVAAYGAGEKWVNAEVVSDVTGGAARPARSIDAEAVGVSRDRQPADAWTGFPPEPVPKPTTPAPPATACDEDVSATEPMMSGDERPLGRIDVGRFDGSRIDADDLMNPGAYAATTASVRTEALCSRLERTLDRAERVNATTQSSMSQFAAVEKHLSTLAAHAERLMAGLNGAVQRHKESAQLTQRCLDRTFEQAETRATSLEAGAERVVQAVDRAEEQTVQVERAAARAEETHTQMTAFAERLADKADEVQERMSVLMAGLESAETTGCRLDQAAKEAMTAAAEADRSATRLRAGVKAAEATGRAFQESCGEAAVERTVKHATKHLQEEIDTQLHTQRERLGSVVTEAEAAREAFQEVCGEPAVERAVEHATQRLQKEIDTQSRTQRERIASVVREAEAAREAFQEACGETAVERAVEHATQRLQKEIDAHLKKHHERIETAIEKGIARFDEARAHLTTATKQSEDGVGALEHAACDITERAAAEVNELKSSMEAIEQRGERALENLHNVTDGVTAVDGRIEKLQPIIERFTTDVDELVRRADGSRTELDAVLSRSDKSLASIQAASGEAEAVRRGVAATLLEIGGTAERVSALREEYNRCAHAMERLTTRQALEQRTAEQMDAVVARGAKLRDELCGLLTAARDHTAAVSDATDGAVHANERLCEALRESETVCERARESNRDAQQSTATACEAVERLASAQAAAVGISAALDGRVDSAGQLREALRSELARADQTLTGIQAEAATASELLSNLAWASDNAANLVDKTRDANETASEALEKTTQGVLRIEALHQESDTLLARMEPVVGEAKRLSLSIDALLVTADDKLTRLNSHHAAASQALTRLSETQKQAQAVATRIDTLKRELDESTGDAKAAIDRRRQDVSTLVQRAQAGAEKLSEVNATAETLIGTIAEKSAPVAELTTRLVETVTQAGERLATIERRCGEAGKLAGRLSSITRILSGAKKLEADVRRSADDARIVFDLLNDRTESAGEQAALLQQLSATARCVIDTCEQVKTETARTSERLGAQTSSADRVFHEREPLITTFAQQTQTIEAVLSELQTRAGTIQKQVDELGAKPQELLEGARAQAAQLEGVCAAVRKVFSAVSQASLDARQQTIDFRKVSDDVASRLDQLTAETDRAANTLAQWVEEAVRVQSRLEGTIQKSPTIRETHPPEELARVSRILSPAGRIAELGKQQRMELVAEPGENTSGDGHAPSRAKKTTGRTEQISQLIEEAKQAAAQTPA